MSLIGLISIWIHDDSERIGLPDLLAAIRTAPGMVPSLIADWKDDSIWNPEIDIEYILGRMQYIFEISARLNWKSRTKVRLLYKSMANGEVYCLQ